MRFRRLPPAALLLFASAALGQEVAPTLPVYHYQANAGEVQLQINVEDSSHRPAAKLSQENFRVLENGVPQTIETFDYQDRPVSLGILIDNSGSMLLKRMQVTRAAMDFIQTSNSADEVFLATFNNDFHVLQEFTNRQEDLQAALGRIQVNGGTALYDALAEALTYMNQHAKHDKKVLLLVTDGADNSSRRKLAAAVATAQAGNGVLVYAIGILDQNTPYNERQSAHDALMAMSTATGGLAFFPNDLIYLDSLSRQIAEDVRRQYSIVYRSDQPAPGLHAIKVEARDAAGKPLEVRTRTGYYVEIPPDAGAVDGGGGRF